MRLRSAVSPYLIEGSVARSLTPLPLLLGLLAITACGGSPTAPTGSAAGGLPPPARGPALKATALDRTSASAPWVNFAERPITFSWDRFPGAGWYAVEVGTSPGAADVLSATTRDLSLTTTFASPGQYYPRVIAYTRSGSQASAERVPLIVLSFQDYVEALLLGTGPLAQVPQQGCPAGAGTMAGWQATSPVTVTLGASLDDEQVQRATSTVGQADLATAGVIRTMVSRSTVLHPLPGSLEIVVHQTGPALAFPCSATALGCTVPEFLGPGVFSRATVVMRRGSALVAHEMAHALFGLCHVSAVAGYVSVMGGFEDFGTGLREADLVALRAVYAAGLRGGATRGAFVAAGLVAP